MGVGNVPQIALVVVCKGIGAVDRPHRIGENGLSEKVVFCLRKLCASFARKDGPEMGASGFQRGNCR